jgi:transcriptional regulator with XRE-family HTH domain
MPNLVSDIISAAKAQGLSQQALAQRAGIHPVSLSRAAKSGRCSLELLEAIAAAAGLRLVCVPDTSLAERLAKGEVF